MKIIVWICPKCMSYYASSSVGDLRTEMNRDAKGKPTFPRSQCGHCQTNRIPHRVKVKLSKEEASA